MKLWPVVATAVVSSAFVWACQGDDGAPDGGGGLGGQGGEATGGAGTGGAGTGGAGTGGSLGGFGGTVSCDPDAGSVAWGGAGGAGGASSEEIFGDWTDQYDSTYSIDESTIDGGYGSYDVVGISAGGQYIVAQNAESNTYFPCLYSRFDWFVDGGDTYLCQTVYGAESVEAALVPPLADPNDLATGCNGFIWSQLSPQ